MGTPSVRPPRQDPDHSPPRRRPAAADRLRSTPCSFPSELRSARGETRHRQPAHRPIRARRNKANRMARRRTRAAGSPRDRRYRHHEHLGDVPHRVRRGGLPSALSAGPDRPMTTRHGTPRRAHLRYVRVWAGGVVGRAPAPIGPADTVRPPGPGHHGCPAGQQFVNPVPDGSAVGWRPVRCDSERSVTPRRRPHVIRESWASAGGWAANCGGRRVLRSGAGRYRSRGRAASRPGRGRRQGPSGRPVSPGPVAGRCRPRAEV